MQGRQKRTLFPESCVRAYADDNAMTTPNFIRDGAAILRIYKEFGQVSNLTLNLPKTVLVPLWPCSLQQMKATLLRDTFPEWCHAQLATWSVYLGFAVGPERAAHSWDKPMSKYSKRATMWEHKRLGLHLTAQSYNTFTFSTLSFVWQLEPVPTIVYEQEDAMLRSLTKGPGRWRLSKDLFFLREHYGQTCSFKSIEHVSLAAKLRVFTLGGLRVQERAATLRSDQAETDHLDRIVRWHEWYENLYLCFSTRRC